MDGRVDALVDAVRSRAWHLLALNHLPDSKFRDMDFLLAAWSYPWCLWALCTVQVLPQHQGDQSGGPKKGTEG